MDFKTKFYFSGNAFSGSRIALTITYNTFKISNEAKMVIDLRLFFKFAYFESFNTKMKVTQY